MPAPALSPDPTRPPVPPSRFVMGSIARHILIMTGTGAVGLMAIFVSDFFTVLFLGQLKDQQVLAAVGYASTILFFLVSAGIGMGIALTSLVAPALGAGDVERARRLATHAHVLSAIVTTVIVAVLWLTVSTLLGWVGARDRTLDLASSYLRIVLPSMPVLALGMCASAAMRSAGDPRRAMYVTLTGAVTGTFLDATLILGLGLGLRGAAIASFVSNASVLIVGWWGVAHKNRLLRKPDWTVFAADAALIARFAVPAVLANVATPAANAYVTAVMSQFSDDAVAGWTVIGRIVPIAFGSIFALTAAIGPIIGQNYGARQFDRVRRSLNGGLATAGLFTAVAWISLVLAAPTLVKLFNASGEAADLIGFYCRWQAPFFVFIGTLFVCNAACNTLGRPHFAAALNWGRATLGTAPFVAVGGAYWEAKGAMMGQSVGAAVFGTVAVLVVRNLIAQLERTAQPAGRH